VGVWQVIDVHILKSDNIILGLILLSHNLFRSITRVLSLSAIATTLCSYLRLFRCTDIHFFHHIYLLPVTRQLEEDVKLSFGGKCDKNNIPEVKLRLTADDPKEKWQKRIHEVGENSTVMFNDGSMQEDGGVRARRWRQDKRIGVGVGLGKVATVWDGEVAGH